MKIFKYIEAFIDFLILPKETKNLKKINKLHERFNRVIMWDEFDEIKYKLSEIDTKEHKDKISLIINLIDVWQKYKK